MIMKKIGSTNAASAISEPMVPVMIFLRLVFVVFIFVVFVFVVFIFATSDPLLIHSCTRWDSRAYIIKPRLAGLCTE
jgi:hypothetical protein